MAMTPYSMHQGKEPDMRANMLSSPSQQYARVSLMSESSFL